MRDAAALWGRRLLMLAVGTVVSQAGIQLFVAVRLGSDPYMVFIQGVARLTGLSNGMAMNIVMLVLMALLLAFTSGYIRPGTVLCTFCVGPLVGAYERLYGLLLPAEPALALRCALILLACVIASFGLAVMLQSEAGACPNDLISVVLSDKIGRLEFRFARIGTDAVLVAAGFLMGGTVGVGTLASVCLYGPIIQVFTPTAKKLARLLHVEEIAARQEKL
ncbi:MAG: hypothetical protein Q4C72_03985 [Eubacteriales bacterium]|nr:hypothetical protein [Eubacteriales bacterium]